MIKKKDFSKATKLELYVIAMDPAERMKDRYAAARELQQRNTGNAVESYKIINVQADAGRWF